jgi:NADH pyrophosphatase NudC (nudix superfamily)
MTQAREKERADDRRSESAGAMSDTLLRDWDSTKKVCPKCGSTRTMEYPGTGAVYCGDCRREFL